MQFRFTADLWEYAGNAAWHFVTLPTDTADAIDEMVGPNRRGFGSVRVEVTIGTSTWRTSVFPDKKAGSFMLPIKKPVRKAERIEAGDAVKVVLRLVELD
ncbi:MAG: DUF1905 domain-containing protein [Acidimicrobiia bacterium]